MTFCTVNRNASFFFNEKNTNQKNYNFFLILKKVTKYLNIYISYSILVLVYFEFFNWEFFENFFVLGFGINFHLIFLLFIYRMPFI